MARASTSNLNISHSRRTRMKIRFLFSFRLNFSEISEQNGRCRGKQTIYRNGIHYNVKLRKH